MHLSRLSTMPICARIFIVCSPCRSSACRRLRCQLSWQLSCHLSRTIEPVDRLHLAHDDELVAIGADRAVVVEAVRELRIAADHVRWLDHDARDRVVYAA